MLTDKIASEKARGKPDSARNRVKNSEPMRMMKIDAVDTTACDTASIMAARVSLRRRIAMTIAAKAPSAPASVGEKTPVKIPPSTTRIKVGSGQTSRKASRRSSGVGLISTLPASDGFSFTRIKIIAM